VPEQTGGVAASPADSLRLPPLFAAVCFSGRPFRDQHVSPEWSLMLIDPALGG